MEILPFIYLAYMFISLYFLNLFLILYLKNRKSFFDYPKVNRNYTVSFIVPAYNAKDTIENALHHIFNIDYSGIIEVIVVNDGSTDNTLDILNKLKKKYPKLVIINNPKNLGNAARSQNVGLKHAKGEIIGIVDDDSYPSKDSVEKMVGFFDDSKVGAVTCPVLPRNKTKFLEKLQMMEYLTISFSRKLLEYIDAIYVTPGPLALYRKKALLEIGGFDENNLTQDIEATWHLTERGWDRKMCLSTSVSSTVPKKIKSWFLQRRRWNVGGLQCIYKYKKHLFKNNMLGIFIIPFFVAGLFLGLLGIIIFSYIFISNAISNFLYTRYSIIAGTPLVSLKEFYITPSFLNYLGIMLFLLEILYLILIFSILKEDIFKKENILNMPFYLIIYLTIYPFIMIDALWQAFFGKKKW
jgi:cellulose synthase/poly-beta-1,6-N-acetylglucosamine synthase-like glycosyltransferase